MAKAPLALVLATLIWLPCMHFLFEPARDDYASAGVPPLARRLAARHLALWRDPARRTEEVGRMRRSNAEWDFMGRTYLVLALVNLGLREPAGIPTLTPVIDAILAETLKVEAEQGFRHFLMPYARDGAFRYKPERSLFVDGELALMLGARLLLGGEPALHAELTRRLRAIEAQLAASPDRWGESYPDECWLFCNSVALAALRTGDHLDGTDHTGLFRDWLASARKRLLDPATGLLWSSWTLDGRAKDGPEGSSIWMAAHCLALIDEPLARDQYERARRELGRTFLGFGWAREWPVSWRGPTDVDSGPIIPVVEASAGSSGLALLGAATFDDRPYLAALHASLAFAAFPTDDGSGLSYAASNQVGDSVMLYSMLQGPAWELIRGRAAR